MSTALLITLGLCVLFLVIILGIFFNIYNGFISLKNQLERSWANIDVILKQRSDEIPNLISVIETFTQFEAGLLDKLANLRKEYLGARGVDAKIESSQEMNRVLTQILAIGEAYPEIKSSEHFSKLQTRISELETTISDRREFYNDTVAIFNAKIEQIPDVIVAKMLSLQKQPMFNVDPSEREMPKIQINTPKF